MDVITITTNNLCFKETVVATAATSDNVEIRLNAKLL